MVTDEILADYYAWRRLPDGTINAVSEMTFGNFRLCLDLGRYGYRDGY